MTTVKDLTRDFASVVTEGDQADHVWCSPSRCIGANALRRLPGVIDARVGADTVRLLKRDGWHRGQLEVNTKAAVKAYDTVHQPLPVGFVFRVVPPRKPLGSRSGEKPGSDRRSGINTSVASRQPSHRHIDVEPP